MRNTGDVTVPTSRGDARLRVDRTTSLTFGAALLFHGAGGDTDASVVVAVRDALLAAGWDVARMDQPYRMAGRRAPDAAPHLDAVATLVVAELRRSLRGRKPGPLLLAGKSSGARVACRIASEVGAAGVVALGFPLHPPGRPEKSRAPELVAAGVPVLVVQGSRDTFGTAADLREIHDDVHEVAGGDHSFACRKADGRTTADCVAEVARVTARWAARLAQAST